MTEDQGQVQTEEKTPKDAVIAAEEDLLDAIELYGVTPENALLREEYMNFPGPLLTKARRLREIIYSFEGLGEDYLASLATTLKQTEKGVAVTWLQALSEQDLKASSSGFDEYVIAQEDLLGAVEDYATMLWQGKYGEVSGKARALRRAVAEHEHLGEDYLDDSSIGALDA